MPTVMRSMVFIVASGCVLAISACGAGRSEIRAAGSSNRAYRDSAGWTISVPVGWYVVRFSDSSRGAAAAGALISNVRLPVPSVASGYPIQVNDRVLPSRGVGLIIATDSDPKLPSGASATPPLPSPGTRESRWLVGSAPAGAPFLETLWFRADGRTLIASAKIGPTASGADREALAQIISSFRQRPAAMGGALRCLPSPLHLDPSAVKAGGILTVSSRRFACAVSYRSGHRYVLSLGQVGRATPVHLGTFPVARDGAFRAVVHVPESGSPGESYIVVRGSSFDQCTDAAASCAGYDARVRVLPRS